VIEIHYGITGYCWKAIQLEIQMKQ